MSRFFVKISVKFRLLDKANMTFYTDYRSIDFLVIFLEFRWNINVTKPFTASDQCELVFACSTQAAYFKFF